MTEGSRSACWGVDSIGFGQYTSRPLIPDSDRNRVPLLEVGQSGFIALVGFRAEQRIPLFDIVGFRKGCAGGGFGCLLAGALLACRIF